MPVIGQDVKHPDIRADRSRYRELLARIIRLEEGGSQGFKVGDMKFQARPDPDSDWTLADFGEMSRTEVGNGKELWDAISDQFGVGDGSTTFNKPDLRHRAPIGPDAGLGLAVGDTGGDFNHVHTNPDTDPAILPELDVAGDTGDDTVDVDLTVDQIELDPLSIGGGDFVAKAQMFTSEPASHGAGTLKVTTGQGSHPHTQDPTGPANQAYTVGAWVIKFR